MRHEKSEAELCQAFDEALQRLDAHGMGVKSDVTFYIFANAGERIGETETVDGLEAFADALDYARSTGWIK